jgi:hypothetical protein
MSSDSSEAALTHDLVQLWRQSRHFLAGSCKGRRKVLSCGERRGQECGDSGGSHLMRGSACMETRCSRRQVRVREMKQMPYLKRGVMAVLACDEEAGPSCSQWPRFGRSAGRTIYAWQRCGSNPLEKYANSRTKTLAITNTDFDTHYCLPRRTDPIMSLLPAYSAQLTAHGLAGQAPCAAGHRFRLCKLRPLSGARGASLSP